MRKEINHGLTQMDTDEYKSNDIENKILVIRNKQVILDRDIATLYGVETKVLNQAVKRNINRFPKEFRFQLRDSEKEELVTICDLQ